MSVTRQDIADTLYNSGFTAAMPELVRWEYSLPSRAYLNGEFKKDWQSELFRYGMETYIDGRNHCLVFSVQALAFAQRYHFKSTNKHSALGMGILKYSKDDGSENHMILWAVTDEPEGLRAMTWEPQMVNGFVVGEVELSGTERNATEFPI